MAPPAPQAQRHKRRVLRSTGASNPLRVSHRAAAITQKSPSALRTNCSNSARSRLTQHRHKPHASSFAPKRRTHDRILHRHINWKNRSAEGRMPSGPALHALPGLAASRAPAKWAWQSTKMRGPGRGGGQKATVAPARPRPVWRPWWQIADLKASARCHWDEARGLGAAALLYPLDHAREELPAT